jgi:PAS domain S-box-containing protein
MDALHDLRYSFNKTFVPAYNVLVYHHLEDLESFRLGIDSVEANLAKCDTVLSERHNRQKLQEFKFYFNRYKHILYQFEGKNFELNTNLGIILLLEIEHDRANLALEYILNETQVEIDRYINTNITTTKHSTLSMGILSIFVIIISYFLGTHFVKKITEPIKKLVDFTQRITRGDFSLIKDIKTQDELEVLANAFNTMIENLGETTISRNYFNDILKSMNESIIVTDEHGIINITNNVTLEMLDYRNEELNNISFDMIFAAGQKGEKKFDYKDSIEYTKSNQEVTYLTKSQAKIPVLLSYSAIKDKNDKVLGIVFVATDLREKKAIERKHVRTRRNQTIRINEAQEKERLRIAKDIHDGLGQTLTGISYYVDTYLGESCESKEVFQEHVAKLQHKLDEAIDESRSIARELVPILLKDFGLIVTLKNFIEQLNSLGKAKFVFKSFNMNDRIDERLETMLYRIVQEATNNINKHANAKNVNIQLINHDNTVSLIIVDDGVGFDQQSTLLDSNRKGIGLVSMQQRVADFYGIFSLNSEINKGTEILVEVPNLKL